MPTEKHLLKVFLCHASADKQKVRELYRYLHRRRIKPWFDEIDLMGGQDWQVEIPKAIATSDAIIVCLTKKSVDKEGYVQKEIKFALDKALEMPEGRIFLIPARFEECEVPFSLSRYQWVDLFNEVGYARMMRALKFHASQLERTAVKLSAEESKEEKFEHEKEEHEATEKAEREKAEKAAREKLEREGVEKARREKAEHEAAEKAAREKTIREATEKAERERRERETAQITKSKRLARFTVVPLLGIGGMIGMIFVLFWVGSWIMSQIPVFLPSTTATLTPTKTPLPGALPMKSPTPQAQQFFTEEFDQDPGSDWVIDIIGPGADAHKDSVKMDFTNSRMRVELPEDDLYFYYTFVGYSYENVRLDLRADNRGVNTNNVSLTCRNSKDGWYEWSVGSGGDWYLYAITDKFNLIISGGTTFLKQGKEVNEYSLVCQDNKIAMFINDQEIEQSPVTDNQYKLREGTVGFNISSINVTPVLVEVDWFKISEP